MGIYSGFLDVKYKSLHNYIYTSHIYFFLIIHANSIKIIIISKGSSYIFYNATLRHIEVTPMVSLLEWWKCKIYLCNHMKGFFYVYFCLKRINCNIGDKFFLHKRNFGALGQIPVFYSTKEQKELSFNYLVVKYLMAKNLEIL